MRMTATKYASRAQPVRSKKKSDTKTGHVTAPLKGLNLATKLTGGDPMSAVILQNFNIEEDRISARDGYKLGMTDAGAKPIETFLPYTGDIPELLAATDGKWLQVPAGTTVHSGFLSNDWLWTMFANLGEQKYLLATSGKDGLWSFDGTTAVRETVTASSTAMPWFDDDILNIVITHQNHVWLADTKNLTVYYLPLQQKNGEVKQLPLNAIFKRGGTVRAMYSWSVDGGTGIDDKLCIFTSNGECALYAGTDPDNDYNLVGVFRFDAPMSKHCVINYGGELYVLISTGLVPMSTLMRAEVENLGKSDQSVVTLFQKIAMAYRNRPGWSVDLDQTSGRMICNLPLGAVNKYGQMAKKMPSKYWTQWVSVPSRCWGWINNRLFFGDDKGNVYEMSPTYLNDDGKPMIVDVQMSWSDFKSPAYKDFKMVRPIFLTDGAPRAYVDVRVDYDFSAPYNQPDSAIVTPGAEWDVAVWDVDSWAFGETAQAAWTGVAGAGRIGAIRCAASITNCRFAIAGFDITWEEGTLMG